MSASFLRKYLNILSDSLPKNYEVDTCEQGCFMKDF